MNWDGRNRRKFPRVLFPCLIKLKDSKDEKNVMLTHAENLSVGGLRVILKNAVPMATLLDIEIDLMDAGDPMSCLGKVVWSERRSDGEAAKPGFYDIGVEFMSVTNADQQRLETIIAHGIKKGKLI